MYISVLISKVIDTSYVDVSLLFSLSALEFVFNY